MPNLPPPAVLPLLCVCAWCGRWRDAAGGWHDPPTAGHPDRPVTHGVCHACFADQLAHETPPGPLRPPAGH